jgi:uncharacterized protein YlxP (DUF503 family)
VKQRGDEERIFVGVLRLVLEVPGARDLKQRRQGVISVRDRIRRRFEVSVHEVGSSEDPQRRTLVITTAGGDSRELRSVLDQCAGIARDHPEVRAAEVQVDVFRWEASAEDWAAQMMQELGGEERG